MPDSLIEILPKVVAEGKKEAEQILDRISNGSRITLQTNEYVLPSKETSGLFRGKIRDDIKQSWQNRLIYGDNLLVMQALLTGDEAQKKEEKRKEKRKGQVSTFDISPLYL